MISRGVAVSAGDPAAVGLIDQTAQHGAETGYRFGPGMAIGIGNVAALSNRQFAFEGAPFFRQIKTAAAAVFGISLLVDEIFLDQLAQDPGQALLGDLQDVQQLADRNAGIGADEMLKRSFFGSRKVNPSADLDEGMLRTIAEVTQGQYFRARSTEELHEIYGLISALEPVEQETRSYRPSKALYYWFLGSAITLFISILLAEFIITQVRKLGFGKGDAS
mgnify:CR=1 FL=1